MSEKKFYSVEEAAALLGLTPAEVNLKRERNVLRGFRDGGNWVFRVEDVEALAKEGRSAKPSDSHDDDSRDVLLSEVELGSGPELGASGTVLGPATGKAAADSDIRLADSELGLDAAAKPAKAPSDSESSADIDLALDDALIDEGNLALDDDASGTVANAPPLKKSEPVKPAGDSAVKLGDKPIKLEDDEVVLGSGSGTGSDVSIGGDSGISLVDPTDSGLSLEEPLEMGRVDDDSLELGEDDMLAFAEDTGESEAPTALKKDEEFLLTPLDEPLEEESDSGSQVIALDSGAAVGDQTATMIAPSVPTDMSSMLEEPMLSGPAQGMAAGVAAGAAVGLGAAAFTAPMGAGAAPQFGEPGIMPVGATIAVPAEAPYSGLQIAGLAVCFALLIPCGWIVYDLVRSIWHWENATGVSSWLLKSLVG